MTITELKILNEGDEVDKVEGSTVYVRAQNADYYIYTFELDQEDQIIDFNVTVIKKGNGVVKVNLDADLNDLKEIKQG